MKEKGVIKHWMATAKEDIKTAQTLFTGKRHHHCLFFCHLFIEKILKALYISRKHTAPPWTHDLLRLAKEAALVTDKTMQEDLREISRFNIAARYNDYKLTFYQKATREFTIKYLRKAKFIYQWIKKEL